MNDQLLVSNAETDQEIGADAIAGTLAAPKCMLVATDIAMNRSTTLAECVAAKATYTGAAPVTVTWSAVTRADDGVIEYLGTVPEFRPTDGAIANAVSGLYVTNTGGTALLFCSRFLLPPMPMESAMDSIRVTLRYRPGAQSMVAIVS